MKTNYRLIACLFLVALLASLATPALAQANKISAGENVLAVSSQAQGLTDPQELEAFLDELMAKDMEEYHIAGAAVSVVKDGQLFFAKGYGYADVQNKIPVDPEETIFRVGSVGKTFTWTAVMQLVEQGKLDLDADINTYLDFRVPDTYPQPITLRHLMTHTSGLEERWFGSGVLDVSDVLPPREFLISNMPARVHPPGEFVGYSNYNAIFGGYIVARVSGQPYDQYIQEHIFNPLGMTRSTVQSPMPPDLKQYASLGYTYADGTFQVFPEYIAQPAGLPSGMHQASVTDMARFMIAHLQGGRYSDATLADARILEESTAQQMMSLLYTPDQRLMGVAYGFFDWSDNGQFTLGHEGYCPPMHSVLLLLPDQNLGVFVAYNSKEVGDLTTQHFGFQRAFFDHYYPAPAVEPVQPPADFTKQADRFVGVYKYSSTPYTTLPKIIGLVGGYTVNISDPGDGTLLLKTMGQESRFAEVEPLYFRQVDGPFSAVFREDGQGRITYVYTDLMPQFSAVRLGWYGAPAFNMALLLGCVLIFLSVIPVGLIRLIRSRTNGDRLALWIILGISILNLLIVTGTTWFMQTMSNELLDPPLIIKIILGLGLLSPILTVGALAYAVRAWVDRHWGIVFRTYYTLVTLAALAYVWFLNYWNLLGWRY